MHGDDHLEQLTLCDTRSGTQETVRAGYLFVFIGAEPRTEWLEGVVARDAKGFVLTGPDLLVRRATAAGLEPRPRPLLPRGQRAGRVRGGRRPGQLDQAGRVGGRRGRDGDPAPPQIPGAPVSEPRTAAARRAADPVPVRGPERRPARLAGRARSRRRVPGRCHDPRRRRTGLVLLRVALRDALDVERVQGGEIELFRTDYYGSYTGAFDAYLPDRGVRSCTRAPPGPSPTAGSSSCPPPTSAGRCGSGSRWPTHLLAGFAIQGRGRQRHGRPARAAGGARFGDRRSHPRAQQSGGRGAARRARRCATGWPRCGTRSARWPAAASPPTNSKRSPTWPARPSIAAGMRRPCHRWRRPTARTSWPTGSRTTASTDGWDLAPTLVAAGVDVAWLERLAEVVRRHRIGCRPVLPGAGAGVRRPARRDHRGGRAHLGVARVGQAVHADGPRAAPDVRRARRPRRHPDDARPQARRRHRGRPRLRPQPPEDLRLPGRAESGVDEPHRQRGRCHGRRRHAHRPHPRPTATIG